MARARLRSTILAGAIACGAGACSLVTSLDGLTGGSGEQPDGSTSDEDATSTSTDGASGVDVANATNDAEDEEAAGDDGASDAGKAPDANRFCASQSPAPLFCDDFDDAGALAATTWDQISSLNGAATLSQGQHVSSPDSMLITTVGGASNYDCAAYRAFTKYAAKPALFTFGFDVYVAQADRTDVSGAVLAALQLYTAAGARYDLQLEVSYDFDAGEALSVDLSEDSHQLDGGHPNVDRPTSIVLPMATWTRVTLALTLGTTAAGLYAANSATWTVGGQASVTFVPDVTVTNGIPEILVGLPYVAPLDTSWSVYYDDVTFNVQAL